MQWAEAYLKCKISQINVNIQEKRRALFLENKTNENKAPI